MQQTGFVQVGLAQSNCCSYGRHRLARILRARHIVRRGRVWIARRFVARRRPAHSAYTSHGWPRVWLLLAATRESPDYFHAAQVAAVFAILCGVTAAVKTHAWYTASPHPWLDPWFLEAQGIALAAYCLAVDGVRGGRSAA